MCTDSLVLNIFYVCLLRFHERCLVCVNMFCLCEHIWHCDGISSLLSAYWRFWLCVSVVYELFLIFILFQVGLESCSHIQKNPVPFCFYLFLSNPAFCCRRCRTDGYLWSTSTRSWVFLCLRETMEETVFSMIQETPLTPSTTSGYKITLFL